MVIWEYEAKSTEHVKHKQFCNTAWDVSRFYFNTLVIN